jgi:hypothetical protein
MSIARPSAANGTPDIDSTLPPTANTPLPGRDLGRGDGAGLKTGGAEAVDQHIDRLAVVACHERGDAGDIAPVLAARHHASEDDVINQAGVYPVAVAHGGQCLCASERAVILCSAPLSPPLPDGGIRRT